MTAISITRELQLEGLVGPTHNYAGLGLGNVASKANANAISNPRAAALQSLDVMAFLHEHGVPVAIMPPQTRPRLDVLHTLMIEGDVEQQLQTVHASAPASLRAIWSASCMWTANAATVCASMDSADSKVHLTPANLLSSLHRVLECHETTHYLRQIFSDADHFTVHDPLNVTTRLADEGAANHMRLCNQKETELLHIFTYGAEPPNSQFPAQYMPRQQRAASEAVAENHQINPEQCLYFQQQPDAIDAGVFHHDVIGMSHRDLTILHEQAWMNQKDCIAELQKAAPWLTIREVNASELSLDDAVKTYFFNAQLVSLDDGSTAIIFPQECAEHAGAKQLAEQLADELPMVSMIHFMDLRESMRNGGGPACLRLRVPLSADELNSVHTGVRFTKKLENQLRGFINRHYRDQVTPKDLLDAGFATEAQQCQRDLLKILSLNPFILND